MTVSKEAVEAAARMLPGSSWEESLIHAENALTAALPHLALQPSQSDEKRALKKFDAQEFISYDTNGVLVATRENVHDALREALAAVRAQEREAMWTKIATAIDDIAPSSWSRSSVIEAIQTRKP